MMDRTLEVFTAELQALGYAAPAPADFDACTHAAADGDVVFMMPTREEQEAAETHGELGWRVYTGCAACCANFASVMFCGGMFTHLLVFADGVLRDRSGAAEIRPADAPVADESAD